KKQGDHFWLDISPSHKEVIVADESEQILEAINDRAITRLIIPEGPAVKTKTYDIQSKNNEPKDGTALYLLETVNSAKQRIKTYIIYSPTGRLNEGPIQIKSTLEAERNVCKSLRESEVLPIDFREKQIKERE